MSGGFPRPLPIWKYTLKERGQAKWRGEKEAPRLLTAARPYFPKKVR
jgi:hypothetical protein